MYGQSQRPPRKIVVSRIDGTQEVSRDTRHMSDTEFRCFAVALHFGRDTYNYLRMPRTLLVVRIDSGKPQPWEPA